MVLYPLQLLGVAGPIRTGRIARELLVRQVGGRPRWTDRLDDVAPCPSVAGGQFSTPDCRIQDAGQIDPVRLVPRA